MKNTHFYLKYKDNIPLERISDEYAKGLIKIGSFQESFFSALNVLSKLGYMVQWTTAIERIENGATSSALLTNYVGQKWEISGAWWVLYHDTPASNDIWVQNQLILQGVIDTEFTITNCYDYIPRHNHTNEDDEQISEWHTSTEALSIFKRKLLLQMGLGGGSS